MLPEFFCLSALRIFFTVYKSYGSIERRSKRLRHDGKLVCLLYKWAGGQSQLLTNDFFSSVSYEEEGSVIRLQEKIELLWGRCLPQTVLIQAWYY